DGLTCVRPAERGCYLDPSSNVGAGLPIRQILPTWSDRNGGILEDARRRDYSEALGLEFPSYGAQQPIIPQRSQGEVAEEDGSAPIRMYRTKRRSADIAREGELGHPRAAEKVQRTPGRADANRRRRKAGEIGGIGLALERQHERFASGRAASVRQAQGKVAAPSNDAQLRRHRSPGPDDRAAGSRPLGQIGPVP